MAGLTIECPKCQAPLKLKDRSLLGKTGKCPRCAHKFVLQEETEIPLELVEVREPVEGKNATWIPDSPASVTPPVPSPAAPPTPPANALPWQTESAPAASPLDALFAASAPPPAASTASAPAADPLSFLQSPTESGPSATSVTAAVSAAASSPVVARRKRKRRQSGGGLIAAAAVLLVLGVGGFLYYRSTLPDAGPLMVIQQDASSPAAVPEGTSPATPAAAPKAPVPVYNPAVVNSPTAGKPIQLYHLPAGVRVAINLRPAQLWNRTDPQAQEFRAALGPFGSWLETRVNELTHQPPEAIEELLIGLILGPRGSEPELALVVHLTEPRSRADLLSTYQGQPLSEFSNELRSDGEWAYKIINDRTIAICPATYAEDLKTFEKSQAMTADHLHEILKTTDRDRLVSVVFDPTDLEHHLDSLFPPAAEQAIEQALRWLGDDVWSAVWSLHLKDEFFTELVVRGKNEVGTNSLNQRYQQRLDALPELLLASVMKMNPQRSGYRQLIGRFPAMVKVLSLTTTTGVDGRFVRMNTLLPPKAAPNLALGTLLTWDESTRTDFNAKPIAATPQKKDTGSLSFKERLQVKMDIEFNRTPLQEAFDYISGESKIPIEIDGDALKLAGFTKNMPQNFAKPQATTLEAIYGIIQRYEKEPIPLAIHLDEKAGQILVLTTKVAEDRNLPIFNFQENGIK